MVGLKRGMRLHGALAQWPHMSAWELRRFAAAASRRFGAAGWLLGACVAMSIGAWVVEWQQLRLLVDTRQQSALHRPADQVPPSLVVDDGRTRLAAFDRLLIEHVDIPLVVRGLLELAEEEQLSVIRGDYKADPDLAGRFMRYRMSVPVKGEAGKIHRYLMAVLRAHPTLALESVQFKRQRIESPEIEARIQWVLFTDLPRQGAPAGEAAAPAARASGVQR